MLYVMFDIYVYLICGIQCLLNDYNLEAFVMIVDYLSHLNHIAATSISSDMEIYFYFDCLFVFRIL